MQLITSSKQLQTYAFHIYPDFLHFLKNWSNYKRFRFIPLVKPNQTPQLVGGWGLGALHHDVIECVLQEAKWIG